MPLCSVRPDKHSRRQLWVCLPDKARPFDRNIRAYSSHLRCQNRRLLFHWKNSIRAALRAGSGRVKSASIHRLRKSLLTIEIFLENKTPTR